MAVRSAMARIQPPRALHAHSHSHARSLATTAMDAAAAAAATSAAHAAAAVSAAATPAAPTAAATTSAVRPALPPRPRLNLLSLSLSQLEGHLAAMQLPRFRAKQLLHWVYSRGARDIHSMDNFSRPLAEKLSERFHIDYGSVVEQKISDADYTRKFVVAFPSARQKLAVPVEGATAAAIVPADRIECVYIPKGKQSDYSAASEGAVCVSSQVGCSLSCTFCHTGTMDKKKLRNLTAAEIVGQVMLVQHALGDFDATAAHKQTDGSVARNGCGGSRRGSVAPISATRNRAVTNIVLMGMGEPLYNYRNVSAAIDTLTSSSRVGGVGLGFGRPRITVSTSGVVPGIDALLHDFGGAVGLAISLHACNDKLRDEIVPINRTFPLANLMDAVRRYQNGWVGSENDGAHGDANAPSAIAGGRKRITFEYVMLAGVNDALSEALSLARLLNDVVALVNLIPFNPWEGSHYVSSSPEHIVRFAAELQRLGVPCTIRWPRGRDINGACGQLAIKHAVQS